MRLMNNNKNKINSKKIWLFKVMLNTTLLTTAI